MQTSSLAESGLADIDESIADTDRNIRRVGSLIPSLASRGFSTTAIEHDLTLLTKALHGLRARRRELVATLDGDEEAPPRIAQSVTRTRHRPGADIAASAVVADNSLKASWRSFYVKLRRA